MAKRLRVHTLAKELGVSSKAILAKCAAEGIELNNHMAPISVGLAESIREWFALSPEVTSIEASSPVDIEKVRRPRRKKRKAKEAEEPPDEFDAAPLVLLLDPGTASAQEIGQLLYEFSTLYRMLGGSGITFTTTDAREPAFA